MFYSGFPQYAYEYGKEQKKINKVNQNSQIYLNAEIKFMCVQNWTQRFILRSN